MNPLETVTLAVIRIITVPSENILRFLRVRGCGEDGVDC
jgi:hypothetical protein